jgi:hypothetical protein
MRKSRILFGRRALVLALGLAATLVLHASAALAASPEASLALNTSDATPVIGQSITLTVTLTVSGSTEPKIGAYSIYDGTKALVSGAQANTTTGFVLSTSSLAPGLHKLSAKYAGAVNGLTATSPTIDVDVSLAVLDTILPPAYEGSSYVGWQLTANGGKAPYKWSLPAGKSLIAGLSLASNGNITGKPTTDNAEYSFSVDVKDSSTPANTGSAKISLPVYAGLVDCVPAGSTATTLGWLKGAYSFHIDQIDMTGSGDPSWVLGRFTSDGEGHLTAGLYDSNGASYTEEHSGSFTGSYAIGKDGRGLFTIKIPVGGGEYETQSYCMALDSMANGVAGAGQIVEDDASDTVAHGRFFAQGSGAAFSAASSWVFGLQGGQLSSSLVDARQAVAGYMTLNGKGTVSAGELDYSGDNVASNGTLQPKYQAETPITGTYKAPTNGRGTITLTVGGGPAHFVYYEAGPGQILLGTTDVGYEPDGGNVVFSGRGYLRTTSTFSNATLSGNTVLISNGLNVVSGKPDGPALRVGLLDWNGKSGGKVSGSADVNQNGKVTLAAENPFSASYSVDAKGRVTVSDVSGGGGAPAFYLFAPDEGVGVQSGTATNFAQLFKQVVPSGGFKGTSLSGGYSAGSLWYGFIQQTATSGELVVDNANETFAVDFDGNLGGDIMPDTGTLTYDPASDGRFLLKEHSGYNTALYFVSTDMGFGIDISGKAWSNLTEVNFFSPNP